MDRRCLVCVSIDPGCFFGYPCLTHTQFIPNPKPGNDPCWRVAEGGQNLRVGQDRRGEVELWFDGGTQTQLFSGTNYFAFVLVVFPKKGSLFFPGSLNN